MDSTNIAWNSKGNGVETTTGPEAQHAAGLQQQLPQQRYLTYNICLNHDVVRLHKPVPEPEHGALYSSQAAAHHDCVHEEARAHIINAPGLAHRAANNS